MTSKAKAHPLNGMHTAGIFSDMSIDGPEIGTLVLVVDRAKNLPNRKTIGKQDPYCAARLGKEAKKTTTDIRGGQTPKWDQELRFTVHDSPDYFQLKVSVFNDDKKTELIGEAWIDLRDMVVPGGGQSDQWHQLGCRGKYAGEVRIEITYYDSRPKPEKPAIKAKPPVPAEPEASPATAAGPRPVPKRRPLPSDPVTGKAPASPSPAPEQVETPPRPQPSLQHDDYNPALPAPPQQHYQQQDYALREPSGEFETGSRRAEAPTHQFRTPDRAEQYAGQPRDPGYSPGYQQQPAYDSRESYEFPQPHEVGGPEDDRPPPPPAHRSRTGSNPSMSAAFQATPPTMRHDVLRNEAHRHSASGSYPGRPTYKAYDSAPAAISGAQYSTAADQTPPSRHYSYDAAYDMPHRTMQATVEDVPESPDSMNRPLRPSGRLQQPHSQPPFEPDYDMSASPAPLSVLPRASTDTGRYAPDPGAPDSRYQGTNGYRMTSSETPQGVLPEFSPQYGRNSEPSLPPRSSHGDQRALVARSEFDDPSNGYSVPQVPPSLVPGMDPSLALEIAERINQDRRQSTQQRPTQQAIMETPPRGRTMDQGYDHDGSPALYNLVPTAHGRSPVTYTNGPSTSSVNVVIKSRAYSPNAPRDLSPNPQQQHTIRRKSVSPRPPVDNPRRLSGVPFGPDSYDALNPSASSAALRDRAAARPDYDETSGKIITHDGREVDPSDHLPMETWAPEPEPKTALSTSPSARPSPSGPQSAPNSGRRPLRVAGRPQSMLPSSSAITFSGGSDHVEPATPTPPVSTGRNRLQKKAAYRQSASAIVPVMSGANGLGSGPGAPSPHDAFRRSSSGDPVPLAPLPPHQDNFTPPRHLPRAATFDYAAGPSSENYAPHHHQHHPHHQHAHSHSPGSGGGVYGTSPNHGHGHGHPPQHSYRGGPPIPAKVPLALPPPPGAGAGAMSGALQLHSSSVARRAGSGIDDGEDDGWQQERGRGQDGRYAQQQQQYERDVYGGGGGMGGGMRGGGGGGGPLSLEEELRSIDIGSGRSARRYAAHGQGHQGHAGQGYVYGQGGY